MSEQKIDAGTLVRTVYAEVFYSLLFSPGRAPSLKKRYRELARKIAGIWYQKATDDYHLERAWRDKLDIAGLNPDLVGTLGSELIRDAGKLERAIQGQ